MMRAFFLLSLLCLPALADSPGLPRSWFLPNERETPRDEAARAREAAPRIEHLMRTNSEALDAFSAAEDKDPALALRKEQGWAIRTIGLDLTISASGTLGLMFARGDATASLSWRRAGQPSTERSRELEDVSPPGREAPLAVPAEASRDELEALLEPMVRATLASGAVREEAAFRANLLDVALKYQRVMRELPADPSSEWTPSRLKLILAVDIMGQVSPAMAVGGGVRLTLEWLASKSPRATLYARAGRGDSQLSRLFRTLSDSLEGIVAEAPPPSGFDLTQLTVGLGVMAQGKFGVVQATGTVLGTVTLSRRASVKLPALPHPAEPGGGPSGSERVAFASPHALSGQFIPLVDHGVAHPIAAEVFRRGMRKAIRIGNFLSERAARSQGKRWELYMVAPSFTLYAGGYIGLVELDGVGTISLTYFKPIASAPRDYRPSREIEKGETVPELAAFAQDTITRVSGALATAPGPDPTAAPWSLRRFFLKIYASVGFDVKAAAIFLYPDLELVWQKEPREAR